MKSKFNIGDTVYLIFPNTEFIKGVVAGRNCERLGWRYEIKVIYHSLYTHYHGIVYGDEEDLCKTIEEVKECFCNRVCNKVDNIVRDKRFLGLEEPIEYPKMKRKCPKFQRKPLKPYKTIAQAKKCKIKAFTPQKRGYKEVISD